MSDAEIPIARPVLGEAEERGVLDVLRSGSASSTWSKVSSAASD